MKATGSKVRKKIKVFTHIPMAVNTQDNFKEILNKVKEHFDTRMEISIQVNGKMEDKMDRESLNSSMATFMRGFSKIML
jgi:hypothetical protein